MPWYYWAAAAYLAAAVIFGGLAAWVELDRSPLATGIQMGLLWPYWLFKFLSPL